MPNPRPGQKLAVLLGEALSAPNTLNSKPGGSVRFPASEVVLDAVAQTYRVPPAPASSSVPHAPRRGILFCAGD